MIQREAFGNSSCCWTVALNEVSFYREHICLSRFSTLPAHKRDVMRDYSCFPIFPSTPPPPSSLTLSTLIDSSLMFDSSVLSARPPSRCRLPRRFLRSPALASAPVHHQLFAFIRRSLACLFSLFCALPNGFLPFPPQPPSQTFIKKLAAWAGQGGVPRYLLLINNIRRHVASKIFNNFTVQRPKNRLG